jgi:glycosyltransferase involved in cell wall biosynthesis
MKLLVVASTFPAGDTDPVPAFVRDQLIALKKLRPDLQISVLAPHDKRSDTVSFRQWPKYDEYRFHYFWPFAVERLAGRGIMPALRANPLKWMLIPFLFIGEFLALLLLTKNLKPDVIYAHWFTPQGMVSSWVGLMTRTPFVFTTHASDVDVWRRIPLLGRYLVRSCAKRAQAFTAVSRRSMQKLRQFFSDEEWQVMQIRGAVIPMGVTLPEFSPRTTAASGSGRRVILFLGRLVEKKGVQYLLPAYAQVRTDLGESLLIIAGDGPMLSHLQRQAAVLGMDSHVLFAGFVSGEKKAGLLRQADLLVVPSIVTGGGDAEGLPVSLLEGLAYGKVCIATAESGADDILVNGRDGFLISEKDESALAKAIREAMLLDPAKRNEIETAARATARQFEWATIARKHCEVLLNPYSEVGV